MELGTKKSQLSNSGFGLGLVDTARCQANLVTICSLILEPHATVCCLFKLALEDRLLSLCSYGNSAKDGFLGLRDQLCLRIF
jgi:hypothetical protein